MPTAERDQEDIIERWMLEIATDGGVDRFDDLHIDTIDPRWKDKTEWIEGALKAFHIAVKMRDRNKMPFSVGLGFSLVSNEAIGEASFRTKEELRAQLDWSPPSLYLFRRGEEPHTQGESANVHPLDPAILGAPGNARCYYLEFNRGADERYRSVFIEG